MTNTTPLLPQWTNFVFGGTAAILAAVLTHPFDLVKTRMQLSGEGGAIKVYHSSLSAFKIIYINDGVRAFYAGFTGAILRQLLFGTTRMGVYNSLYAVRRKQVNEKGKSMSFLDRAACGTVGGMCGALVGNPSEVVLVRMTSDGRLPMEQRRNYRNAVQAVYRIFKEEGIRTLYKGLNSTILRSVVLNVFQLGMYSQIKTFVLAHGFKDDQILVPGISSFGAGFVASVASLPFDIIKTRLQTMHPGQYTGMFDCAKYLYKNEGVFGFWKGMIPYFFRIAPQTVYIFLILEQLNYFYIKYFTKPRNIPRKRRFFNKRAE